jgi:YggT family protein
MVNAINLIFGAVQLAILGRVLLSWVDPDPYPNSELKRLLWAVTDPILEPLRRVVPPLGMLDITPMVAIVLLYVVQQLLLAALPGR